jgi:hypothetical protein
MRLRSKHRRTDSLYHLIGPEVFRTISKAVSPLLVFHCSSCNHTIAKQQQSPQAVRQVPREGQRVTEEADEDW